MKLALHDRHGVVRHDVRDTLILALRAGAFYAGYVAFTLLWGIVVLAVGWLLPLRARFAFVAQAWSGVVLAWLRLTCGIRYRLHGGEHIPREPCIVMSRHESTWEILVLQHLFAPQATLLKRELMHIPVFGWGLRLVRPIPIDRSDPRAALRTLLDRGRQCLAEGIWVVLFPEGTRLRPGARARFQSGGAALARASGKPVLVVAHDAGRCWPARRFLKYPGTIELVVAPPIDVSGLGRREINALAEQTMANELAKIDERSHVEIDRG